MRYEDRTPDDRVNIPDRHPLKDFAKLSVMAVITVIVLGLLLSVVGGRLAGILPYKTELWLTERIEQVALQADQESPFAVDVANEELQNYLQSVADKVAVALNIEETMPITLHYSDEDIVNAYATIGGHVYFFNGLLSMLPHENALAMLMAHEYAHVKLRHPIESLGGGLALALGTSVVGFSSDNRLFSLATRLTSTSFSRGMEVQADESALSAVFSMYGHVDGAAALFKVFMLQRQQGAGAQFERFISTHPLDQERIDRISQLASDNHWMAIGDLTPLPENFSNWLRL